ncbi:MAG: hypothetical protein EOP83_01180 [Verrucomicrobiaceae bacterium]|nr:MAG: hypothetical protein EOP83_01180 [Verrucomicrobiaceae bacterium]
MNPPSKQEVDQMANLMRILEGKSAVEAAIPESVASTQAAAITTPNPVTGTAQQDKEAMKNVLMALRNVTESADPEIQDEEVREAFVTERTERGVRIDAWEIIVNEGKTKTYDVVSTSGDTVIAKDLYVYEAALGLVRRLNEGVAINDKRIAQVLKLEENFARNRDNAVAFKESYRRAEAAGDSRRAAIAEDRQEASVRQAVSDMEEILKLAGLRH